MIIPSTTGQATAQQDNQGYAQVLKTTRFDGPTFMANLAAREEQRKQQELKEGLELKRRNRDFMAKLPTVKDFTPYIEKELAAELEAAELSLAELSAQEGVDLTLEPKGYETIRDYTNKINRLQGYGREIQDAVDMYAGKLAANPEKYDSQEFAKWVENMKKIDGIEAKREYALTNPPWEDKFDAVDFLSEIPIKYTAIEQGIETVKEYDRDAVRSLTDAEIFSMGQSSDKKEALDRYYNEGVKAGYWKDYDGMIDYMTDLKMKLGGKSVGQDEPRSSSSFNWSASFGAGTGGTKDRALSAVYEPKFAGEPNKVNALVMISPTGDTRPMELTGDDAEPIYVKPGSAIIVNPDNTMTVKGSKARRITSEQFKKEASESGMDMNAFKQQFVQKYGGSSNVDFEDDGSVMILEGEKVTVTIRPYDTNYSLIKGVYQTDPIKLIEAKNAELAKKSGGAKPAATKAPAKTINVGSFFPKK